MDFTEEYAGLIGSLMSLIRSATQLSSLDVGFLRSLSPELAERSEVASNDLLDLINTLLAKSNSSTGQESVKRLHSSDEVLSQWRGIEQIFDLLMDKIDSPPHLSKSALDSSQNNSSNNSNCSNSSGSGNSSGTSNVAEYMRLSNNISKPQLKFRTKVDNSLRAFKPLLTSKPFATEMDLKNSLLLKPADCDHEWDWYDQPYRAEIANAEFPHLKLLDTTVLEEFPDWNSTPLTFVDTPEELFKMVAKLEQADTVAIDVEHHDYRSYLGIVCLLQISALGEDYVVDALALRSELQILNKVFANPHIVKVLHGARMDIMWLQRDLGVYIVNLFDTYFAARELQFPKLSLAYLLQRFANFDAQKEYQLADWRFRPLPQELIDYARADTHFLLYIYGQLRKMLTNAGIMANAVEASREVAGRRYEYPGWNDKEPAWYAFVLKYRLTSHLQRVIAIRLLEWRDAMARKHDESTRFVMSPPFLANLCVIKPHNAEGVLAAGHKTSSIVTQNATAIAELVQRACKEEASVDTSIPDIYKSRRMRNYAPEPPASSANQNEIATSDLKLLHSKFMGDSQTTTTELPESHVYLGVYDESDLEHMQQHLLQEKLQQQQLSEASQADASSRASSESQSGSDSGLDSGSDSNSDSDSDSDSQSVVASESQTKRKTGRRLQIVDQTDDIELSTKMERVNKSRKMMPDEPAFDFASAPKVMKDTPQEDSKSYRRFNGAQGPKGAHKNNSNFKKARSFRK